MDKQAVAGRMLHPGARAKGSDESAVYRLFDDTGRLLYVGLSTNPMNRWAAHAEQHAWWPDVANFTVAWYGARVEAAAEEKRAIREESPLRNTHSTGRHGAVTGAGVRARNEAQRNLLVRKAPEAVGAPAE
ncbi:GIY-YIG nuclease family protein [[Kitasatospora] papulosa]|uniref:GIY-YIG nuclease family protein n=1 Tax=[Kitasatospora] papulosa TaxID=1464011 RepID=UPI00368CC1B3